MRCNYRCNMWCNCKKPAKPYPTTPSISAPTVESLELTPNSGQDINFTYTPTDAELSVSITSSDTNVVQTFPLVYENGSARFNAMGIDEGDATITITNNDNPSETYSVSVHVENVEPFVPANNIIVDVESEGEATARKTRSKKVRGSGDTYHARVFAEEYESADYVQLNWGYLATPDVSYIGKTASDEHCLNMFTTDVINNIARNIETLHDGGQLGGSCEFEDVAWLNIQNYFNAPYSQESAEQLVAQLSEGEIVEPISSGVTISGLDGYYFEIPYTQGITEVVYYTPADGDISNLVATVDDPSMVSVNFAWNDNGLAYYTIAALTDSGCTAVRFTDGENTYACDVCCTPFVHVNSISSPSLSEVSVAQGTTKHSYFSYTPEYSSAPTNDITVNPNNVSYSWRCDGGVSDFDIYYRGTDGDGTISYYLNSDPETVYTITVHNVTPTVPVESLSGIPSEVAHLAPETGRTFIVTYTPEDADEIESQIQVTYDDPNIVGVGIRNVDTGAHTFLMDYYGKAEGSTNVHFYLNGNLVTETSVTIERPVIETIDNLQYTNPTADGGEVYSRGFHSPVTFEYTPTKGAGGLTITKTGGTKVDGTPWDAPGRDADQSISTEGIDYNNGVATLNCYVDNEASVGQRGSWRIEVENDPNQYLDVKITFANEPQPSTDCTITVAVNDDTMGSVDVPSVTVPVNTAISYNGNQVTIGSTTVTATANSGYQQRGWSNMIFTATEDATIMAEFEAETPASSYELTITTTEGTVEKEAGEGTEEASFPAPIESGGRISWDGAGVFGVYDSQGNWLTDYVVRNNGTDVYAADATVNGDSWPTNDETGDPVDVNVEGDTTIVVSNIIWPTTAISVDSSAVNGTITRTGNWEYVSETGVWQIGGLTGEALLTPSQSEDGVFSLIIEDDGNTWTFDIVPDNFDDYVGWGGDEGFEITGPTNIYAMPGYLDTVNIYPTTITPDPEAQ